ncbi:MAG: hypothetical protein F6K53_42660 [Moorea sp. SIO4A1]|uniref:hypothetical protein n=1 Tax=Moorena sp. SIO4A1 TaxID=2607835 RepID=UPI00144F8603|nr:hypothetical protein [Moorena sp. SIO4A1]NEQ63652.1 hypothetical protein [Moorena sp. SIO4A1]
MGETTAVAHGEGLCAEPASAPVLMQRGHGGNPHDRAASLSSPVGTPKTALPPQDRAASLQTYHDTAKPISSLASDIPFYPSAHHRITPCVDTGLGC